MSWKKAFLEETQIVNKKESLLENQRTIQENNRLFLRGKKALQENKRKL